MNISTYCEKARSVAIYPKEASFYYPALGLAGELGETIDKLTLLPKEVPANKEAVTGEIGDLLWYVVSVAADAGVTALDLVTRGPGRVKNFTELGMYQVSTDHRSPLIRLPIHAGRIAEIAKKMIRGDSSGKLTSEKQHVVLNSLNEITRCLFEVAKEWSINMDDVAQANIDKLFSRRDRGVLKGDGDNR